MTRKILSLLMAAAMLVLCFAAVLEPTSAEAEILKVTGSTVVAVGKSITLEANKSVTWSSGDKKIATVSKSGIVKGKKAGEVKITAKDKNGKKKTLQVTVYADPVKSVKITAKTLELDLEGTKTIQLKAKASPETAAQSFTWKSSDTSVATVTSSGKVKAVGKGTVKITATAKDGSKKKKTVTITVKSSALIKIGIVNNPPSESSYREANVNDFEKVFSAANGYALNSFYSWNGDDQKDAALQFIYDGADYLLVCAADPSGWEDILQAAKDKGVGVFLFDRMIDCSSDLYIAAVVSSMAQEGKNAVNWLLAQNLEKYEVIHIQGWKGSDAQIGRSSALDAQFKNGKMTKVVQKSASWDEAEAKQIVASAIKAGKSFNVIYAENDGMARGAVAALDEAGITHGVNGDVIIMGFDSNKWALRELLAGNWNYDGPCSPFQASPIHKMIQKLEKGEKITGLNGQKQYINPEKGFDARTITQKDVDKYGLGD